jgi:hypothetical protein
MADFEIEGLAEAKKAFDDREAKVKRYTPEAMKDIGNDLLRRSAKRAPKDMGDLRGSGFAEMDDYTVTVGFTEEYALAQHERLDYQHTDGEAKYLENPLNENQDKYIKKLADSLKGGLK